MSTVVDLAALGSQGFAIEGASSFDGAGVSVSDAGDVNGDGFDDIIIGASGSDSGGPGAGAAYVIFGGAGGFGTIDLANLDPADGFVIRGADFDYAGVRVAGAGDVNGDGFDDIIIGTLNGSYYYGGTPRSYIIFGREESFVTLDLDDTLSASDGFVIEGEFGYGYGGHSIASAGDINGDGFDDIIIGALYDYNNAGAAYVIFGKESGFGTISLADLDSSDGFEILGGAIYDFAGRSVSGAGDVNGDGFDDIIIGVVGNDEGAYVIFGKESGFGTIDLGNLAADDGFRIVAAVPGDQAGISVSSAGDFNGDGFADVIIGASDADGGGNYSGEAYVVFGKSGGFGTIDLGNLDPADGFVIQGDSANDVAGLSVSGAGDVNGDGFDDVIVGALGGDDGGTDAGEAYVIFGKASGFDTIDLTNLDPADGFIIQGESAMDLAGSSVSGAGDLNGDGFADIIVGAPENDGAAPGAGAAYVIFGAAAPGVTRIGSAGSDTLHGTAFDDHLDGRGGDDSLLGADGSDRLFGREGNDLLDAGGGDDILFGGSGNDDLHGRGGRDRLEGGAGIDRMYGGGGDDIFVVTDATDYAYERASEGIDRVFSSVSLELRANVEHLTLFGASNLIGEGNGLANSIVGNSGSNRLYGFAGDDRLHGQDGNDRLDGGAGVDRLYGGAGNDVYVVRDATDYAYEFAVEGTDRVFASVDHELRSNVENLTLTGSLDLIGEGNALANFVVGNGGSNRLYGRAGDDRLYGRAGDDALFGEAGGDLLNGGGGADWLEGGAGRDQFHGGGGSDRFVFRDGDFFGTGSSADRIHDFGDAEGDRIRLDLVDANTNVGGDQNFAFLGTGAFTGSAGELRYQQIGGNTYVQGDTNGDGSADFWIRVDGLHTLASDDFIF